MRQGHLPHAPQEGPASPCAVSVPPPRTANTPGPKPSRGQHRAWSSLSRLNLRASVLAVLGAAAPLPAAIPFSAQVPTSGRGPGGLRAALGARRDASDAHLRMRRGGCGAGGAAGAEQSPQRPPPSPPSRRPARPARLRARRCPAGRAHPRQRMGKAAPREPLA